MGRISITSIFRLTAPLAACTCGTASASLRGILFNEQRDLEQQAPDVVTHRCSIDVEEDVDEGGLDDNDIGPSDGVVTCIQKSMASNMNDFAQKHHAEHAQKMEHHEETGIRHPFEGMAWATSRILFNRDEEKISMTVADDDAARLRVFDGDELVTKEKIPLLEDHDVEDIAEAPVLEAFTPPRSRRKKKGKNRRRRKFVLNIKAACELCPNNNKDAGRRALDSAPEDDSSEPSFETWMNEHLRQVIALDCEETVFARTMFSKEVNGMVTSSSDPTFHFAAQNGGIKEPVELLLTSQPTTSPKPLPTVNPTPSPTQNVTLFNQPPPPTTNSSIARADRSTDDDCFKKCGSRRVDMCSANDSQCTFFVDLGGGKCQKCCQKRGGTCLSAEKTVDKSCAHGGGAHGCRSKATTAICTCTL